MISVHKELERTLVKINSSSLSVIQECPRKAQYLLYEGWKERNESMPLIAGKAWHKFQEIFYAGSPEERVLPKYEHLEMMAYGHKPPVTNNDLVYRAVAAMITEAQPLAGLPVGDKRSIQNLVWLAYGYLQSHIDDPYITYRDEYGPFVERSFEFVIFEDEKLKIVYFGTIDAAWKHIVTNEIYLVDHKTTSSLSGYGDNASYFEKDKPNAQYTGYWMGANRAFNLNIAGFLINVCEMKAKPKRDTTKGAGFPQQVTMRDENDFAELVDSVVKAVRDYLYFLDHKKWPMGPVSSCNLWGACTYKPVCSAPQTVRETILSNKFSRVPNA